MDLEIWFNLAPLRIYDQTGSLETEASKMTNLTQAPILTAIYSGPDLRAVSL